MAEKEEFKIKTECLEDLDIVMDIVQKSDHPDRRRLISSLEIIDQFCDRWRET